MSPAIPIPPPGRRFRAFNFRRPVLAGILLLSGLLAWPRAQADSRLWTDLDGRRYDAEIYSISDGQITLRRPDGRTLTLDMDDLIATDQLAAREWLLAQPKGSGESPPPTQTLSPFGRSFIIDEPRVLRVRALLAHGYPRPYLGIPIIVRNTSAGALEFVNVYFFDDQKQRIPFPLWPPNSPIMIKDGVTTAIVRPGDFKPGQTYMVLFPMIDPALRTAPTAVVVAGNSLQVAAVVYPEGTWRDFNFPERERLLTDKYADYAGQELYTELKPADLFNLNDVVHLVPLNGDHSPTRDFFRMSLRVFKPFPAAALSGRWYAFDKNHQLLHAEDLPPFAVPGRKDGFYVPLLAGTGPAELGAAVPPTEGENLHMIQLPGGAWWDRPEVDSIVFVFGTETKKVARVYSKSGATFADLPVPEKASFAGAAPATEKEIPTRQY